MALKKFEEYAKEFVGKKDGTSTLQNPIANKPKEDTTVVEKLKVRNLKSSPAPTPTPKKIQENAFLVGNDFKVKVVIDVPQALVQEYIDKVKNETDKDPLDNFSEAEIAEQIVTFLIKQNMVIDNLTPDFTVGSENVGSSEKNQETVEQDAEDLSNDLDVNSDSDSDNDSEEADGEIEFKDFNDSETEKETMPEDEASDGEIEFSEETEKKDLGEKREVEDKESDPDSNFEEIEFSDENEKGEAKPKTIGDLKKNQGETVNTQHKEEEKSTEEEEEIEDMYKKIGYKVGYFESLNMNNLRKY